MFCCYFCISRYLLRHVLDCQCRVHCSYKLCCVFRSFVCVRVRVRVCNVSMWMFIPVFIRLLIESLLLFQHEKIYHYILSISVLHALSQCLCVSISVHVRAYMRVSACVCVRVCGGLVCTCLCKRIYLSIHVFACMCLKHISSFRHWTFALASIVFSSPSQSSIWAASARASLSSLYSVQLCSFDDCVSSYIQFCDYFACETK